MNKSPLAPGGGKAPSNFSEGGGFANVLIYNDLLTQCPKSMTNNPNQ
ncbi:MAG: hypothetical protein MUE85_10550 [Microscillaceae bacterium]|nr:hypothetical protein [Microscillaceae bacterium]